MATGSLGQGLSVACGMAYVGKFLDKASYRTYCLMGDGESMEVIIILHIFFERYENIFIFNSFLGKRLGSHQLCRILQVG